MPSFSSTAVAATVGYVNGAKTERGGRKILLSAFPFSFFGVLLGERFILYLHTSQASSSSSKKKRLKLGENNFPFEKFVIAICAGENVKISPVIVNFRACFHESVCVNVFVR